METIVRAPIVINENGVALIEGTTTRVTEVVLNKEWLGQSPEELQRDMPHLSLAQIYGALSYYHQHRLQLDAQIEREEREAELLREQAGESPFAKRMRSSGRVG